MNPNPKRILGFSILLIAFSLFLIVSPALTKKDKSSLIVVPSENRFNLHFNIAAGDLNDFSRILENLRFPQSILKGVEFELDATSTAKLAYLTPIKAQLDFSPHKVDFAGKIEQAIFPKEFLVERIKVPASANLVIMAPDFGDFIKMRFLQSPQFLDWLEKNLNLYPGQYLVIFGQDSDYALVFKTRKEVDFESLKNVQIGESFEPAYKEETQENINFHLIQLPTKSDQAKESSVIFEVGDLVFLTSSRTVATQIVQAQKPQIPLFDLSGISLPRSASLAIFFRNNQNSQNQDILNLLLSYPEGLGTSQEKIQQIVSHIKEVQFILKDREFSGLINIK